MRNLTKNDLELIKDTMCGAFSIYRIKKGEPEVIYVSDEIYLACGMTRDDFLDHSQDNIASILVPSDRKLFLDDMRDSVLLGKNIDVRFRMIGNQGVIWVRARGHACGTLDGDPIIVVSYTSELDNTSYFKEILDNIDCQVYICDRKTKELLYANEAALKIKSDDAVLMRNESCHKFFFGLAEPCADCLISQLDDVPVSREEYMEKFNKWIHIEIVPISLSHHDIFIIYLYDISERKQREDHYLQMISQLEKLHSDVLGSFHLNLTNNWCGEGKSPLEFVLKQQELGTVDGYFLEFFKLIADESVKRDFEATFQREKLIQAFHQGKTETKMEYPIAYKDGIHWHLACLYMFENPSTGDVEGRTYAVDIDERKRREFIVQELMNKDFDFVALLNLETNKIKEYTSKGRNYYADHRLEDVDYTPAMIASIKNFIRPDLMEEAITAHSIDVIKAKLAEKKVYRVSFPTKDGRIEEWRISLSCRQNKPTRPNRPSFPI